MHRYVALCLLVREANISYASLCCTVSVGEGSKYKLCIAMLHCVWNINCSHEVYPSVSSFSRGKGFEVVSVVSATFIGRGASRNSSSSKGLEEMVNDAIDMFCLFFVTILWTNGGGGRGGGGGINN